jgi:small-conductance mechanosensitive channel
LSATAHAGRAAPPRSGLWRRALAAGLLAWAFVPAAAAKVPATAEAAAAPDAALAIAPADIPSRADADERYAQAVQRRAQSLEVLRRFDEALARQATALDRMSELTDSGDLSLMSVRRLESLERYWRLKERQLEQTRSELARLTNSASEAAAELTSRRAAWQATSEQPSLSPALQRRSQELVAQIDRAQAVLSPPLSRLIDLGRRGNALSAQLQRSMGEVTAQVAAMDRRLVTMDMPPLWQATGDGAGREPVSTGLRRGLGIERAFAADFDAANARLLPALGVLAVLLLPLMFWIKRRARHLVESGQLGDHVPQPLARPWAAWLLLVAAIAVLYGLQGPSLRQELVMLLAWVPVLGLLQRHMLRLFGPWAYLSAAFYFLNLVASLFIGDPMLYRLLLLGLNLLMLALLAGALWRARRDDDAARPLRRGRWRAVALLVCSVLLAAAIANLVGNISLAAMLVSATLDSIYAALAIYAGSTVLLSVSQALLTGPTAARISSRYGASLLPAVQNLGRAALFAAWLLFTLQAFRIYRPASSLATTVLTHEFKLGELALSLGGLLTFALATWAAFWVAKTLRQLLAEDILPSLSLPRGVGNSVSSLSYYVVLFLGLLAALAAAGFQVGQLTIIFGALGVGIGIGLQDVVRNFVSGLILMFERPIQRGDTVEVAGMEGTVREIGLRATIVTTWDGADVVVPNGMLLADKLVNWTLNGTRRRVTMNVSTSFAAAPQRTIEVLLAIARSVDGVALSPAPAVIMTGMAPGELLFNVRVWTTEFSDWINVRTELTMKIRDGLAEAGIEVPRPQRELIVRSMPPQAAQELGKAAGAAPT